MVVFLRQARPKHFLNKSRVQMLPRPGSLSTPTSPFIICTSRRAMGCAYTWAYTQDTSKLVDCGNWIKCGQALSDGGGLDIGKG